MSSAKKAKGKFVLCSHINKFSFGFFHRAKPVTEVERSGTEVHCGPAGSGTEVPNGPAGSGTEVPNGPAGSGTEVPSGQQPAREMRWNRY